MHNFDLIEILNSYERENSSSNVQSGLPKYGPHFAQNINLLINHFKLIIYFFLSNGLLM